MGRPAGPTLLEKDRQSVGTPQNLCVALAYVYKYGGRLIWAISSSRVRACSHPYDNT
jgi:hypothetical protein